MTFFLNNQKWFSYKSKWKSKPYYNLKIQWDLIFIEENPRKVKIFKYFKF